jgi:sulfur carrier protein
MTITLNGEPVDFAGTVADLVQQRYGDRRGLAVAVEGAVVPRGAWPTAVLVPGQCVEVVTAVQGG